MHYVLHCEILKPILKYFFLFHRSQLHPGEPKVQGGLKGACQWTVLIPK